MHTELIFLKAIGLNSAVHNGARIVGPSVAGLLMAGFGIHQEGDVWKMNLFRKSLSYEDRIFNYTVGIVMVNFAPSSLF